MVTLYSNYGRGLLKRLEAVDALTRSSPDVAAFIDKCNADLDPVSVVCRARLSPGSLSAFRI